MNCDTNHLVSKKHLDTLPEDAKKEYEPVPEGLNRAARRKLAGKSEAHVSFNSGGKLSKWAAKKRKGKSKHAKKSRRKNRCL